MEGFKKAGVNTFDIWKDLFIELHQFKYGIGKERGRFWTEKLYHQKWSTEEIREVTDRWSGEVIDDITEQLARLE